MNAVDLALVLAVDASASVTFDEFGNYVPHDDQDNKNGGSKSGWVN